MKFWQKINRNQNETTLRPPFRPPRKRELKDLTKNKKIDSASAFIVVAILATTFSRRVCAGNVKKIFEIIFLNLLPNWAQVYEPNVNSCRTL